MVIPTAVRSLLVVRGSLKLYLSRAVNLSLLNRSGGYMAFQSGKSSPVEER